MLASRIICAAITVVFSAAAVALGLVCLFAGFDEKSLDDIQIIKLQFNASSLLTKAASEVLDVAGELANSIGIDPGSIDIPGIDKRASAKDDLETLAHEFVQRIGFSEIYDWHILTICQQEISNKKDGSAEDKSQKCSNPAATLKIDLKAEIRKLIIKASSKVGGIVDKSSDKLIDFVESQDFYKKLDNWTDIARTLIKAFVILYAVGAVLAVLSIFAGLFGLFTACKVRHRSKHAEKPRKSGFSSLLEVLIILCLILTFVAFTLASICVTVAALKAPQLINGAAKDYGVSARAGKSFLGISWAATACALIALISYWIRTGFCCGKVRRERKSVVSEKY